MKISIFIESIILDNEFKPIDGVVEKLNTWIEKGAEISYLTRINKFMEFKKLSDQMDDLGFSIKNIKTKQDNEKFIDIVSEIQPRILIERLGSSEDKKTVGEKLKTEFKFNSIILDDEQNLADLPDDLEELKTFGEKKEDEE